MKKIISVAENEVRRVVSVSFPGEGGRGANDKSLGEIDCLLRGLACAADPEGSLRPGVRFYLVKKIILKIIKPYTRYQTLFNKRIVEVISELVSR